MMMTVKIGGTHTEGHGHAPVSDADGGAPMVDDADTREPSLYRRCQQLRLVLDHERQVRAALVAENERLRADVLMLRARVEAQALRIAADD